MDTITWRPKMILASFAVLTTLVGTTLTVENHFATKEEMNQGFLVAAAERKVNTYRLDQKLVEDAIRFHRERLYALEDRYGRNLERGTERDRREYEEVREEIEQLREKLKHIQKYILEQSNRQK